MSDEAIEALVSEEAPTPETAAHVVALAIAARRLYDLKKKLEEETEQAKKAFEVAADALVTAMLAVQPSPMTKFRTPETGLVFLKRFEQVNVETEEAAWEILKQIGRYDGVVKLTAHYATLTKALQDWAEENGTRLEEAVAKLNERKEGEESKAFKYFGRPRVGFRA